METIEDLLQKVRDHISLGGEKVEITPAQPQAGSILKCPICNIDASPREFMVSGRKVGYRCNADKTHVVAPISIASKRYLVWYGTYEVADEDLAEQIYEHDDGASVSRGKIEQLCSELGRQVTTLIDNWLSLRAAEAKKRLSNPQEVDRTTLWRRISEEYEQAACISSVEIFTASAGLDCFTQEWPENAAVGNGINLAQINEKYARGEMSFREESGGYCYLLRFNDRVLAVVRVCYQTDEDDLEKAGIRLEKLSLALADTLDFRRRARAQENILKIQKEEVSKNDASRHYDCLNKSLQLCRDLLECDSAELIIRPKQQRDNTSDRLPVLLRDPSVNLDLPWKHPANDEAIVNATNTKKPAFVSRGQTHSLSVECDAFKKHYNEDIVQNYRDYREQIQSTICIPLIFGDEVIATYSFHKKKAEPFYLGLVHVVELILEYVASYVRDVQLALTNSPQPPVNDNLSSASQQEERQRLIGEILQTAKERTGATRAAVALFGQRNDELAIFGPRVPSGSSSTSNWPNNYFETRIRRDRTDSAVAYAVRSQKNYLIDDVNEKEVFYFRPSGDMCRIISSANILMVVSQSNIIGVLIVEWELANRATLFEDELQRIADEYAYRLHDLEVHSRAIEIASSLQKVEEIEQLPGALDICTRNLAAMIGPGNYQFYLRDRNTGEFTPKGSASGEGRSAVGLESLQLLLLRLGLLAPASYCAPPYDDFGKLRRTSGSPATSGLNSADSLLCGGTLQHMCLDREVEVLSRSEAVRGLIKDSMFTPIRLGPHLSEEQYVSIRGKRRQANSVIPQAAVFGVLISTTGSTRSVQDGYDLVSIQAAETVVDSIRDRLDLLAEQSLSKGYRRLVDICFGGANDQKRAGGVSDVAKRTLDCLEECLGHLGAHIRLLDRNYNGRCVAMRIAYRRPDWLTAEEKFFPNLIQPVESDATGWVYKNNQVFYDPDCRSEDSFCHSLSTPDWFLERVGSVLVVPLRRGDELLGTLHLYKSFAWSFSPREIRFVGEAVAPLVANAIQTTELLCQNSLRERIGTDAQQLKVQLERSSRQFNQMELDETGLKTFLSCSANMLFQLLRINSVFALLVEKGDLRLCWSDVDMPEPNDWKFSVQWKREVFADSSVIDSTFEFASSDRLDSIRKWLVSQFPHERLRKQLRSLCDCELSVFYRGLDVDGRRIVFFFQPAEGFAINSSIISTLVEAYAQLSGDISQFLEQMRFRAAERRREEGSMAPLVMMGAAMSHFEHALRMPLSVLQSNIKMVLNNLESVEKVTKAAGNMQKEVQYLSSFVEQVLRAARALDQSSFTAFSLREVVISSLSPHCQIMHCEGEVGLSGDDTLLLQFPDRTSIPLVFDIEPNLPKVIGSVRGLEVAFSFLLGNAIEAIKAVKGSERGVVRRILIYGKRRSKRVGYADADGIEVVIEDEGIGMSPELSNRVDQPFVSTKPTGTGLGLTCAKYIIRCHGSEISISSQCYPQRTSGTFVSFVLPTSKKD